MRELVLAPNQHEFSYLDIQSCWQKAITGVDSYHNSFFCSRARGSSADKVSVVSSAYIVGFEKRLQAGRSLM